MATAKIGLVDLPFVRARGVKKSFILVQGGMGMRVSGPSLVAEVCSYGVIGTLSSAGLCDFHIESDGKKATARNAARYEVEEARLRSRIKNPFIAMNIMVELKKDYKDSVLGSIEGDVAAIISGAGFPLSLPKLVREAEALDHVALIPIISSARAASIICKKWKKNHDYIPDAVIIEGDKAGGHLGFDPNDIGKKENSLEKIFVETREFLDDFYRDIGVRVPIIVAGGIFYNEDIAYWIDQMGADGVQMGSRFAATKESGASLEFKQAIIEATEDDIVVCGKSPCGFPFRVIKSSPGYQEAINNPQAAKCKFGYVLQKDKETEVFHLCPAKDTCDYFCICGGLVAAVGGKSDYGAVYTIGSRGYLIKEIITVDELMRELGIIQ